VAVQYFAIQEKAYEAFYKLTNHRGQITSYVFDGIRSSFPKLDLDSAFESKDSVAKNVQEQLAAQMEEYGYRIVNVLIIDVEPDSKYIYVLHAVLFVLLLLLLLTPRTASATLNSSHIS
jgi:regulator of protease activity HflC (stomatin/prohibitin superfamily)